MLDITLTSVRGKVKPDNDKKSRAYENIKDLKRDYRELKEVYAKEGLKAPVILA